MIAWKHLRRTVISERVMILKLAGKDLIVMGAGIAGIRAAIAAPRRGLDVLLVERNGSVGDLSTAGLCSPFIRFWLGNESFVSGIFKEVLYGLHRRGGLLRGSFNLEILKMIYLEKLKKAGVVLSFRSIPVKLISAGGFMKQISLLVPSVNLRSK